MLILFYQDNLQKGDLVDRKTIVAASLLSADFIELGKECARAADGGCDWLHFDIMDGSFVPAISFGGPVLKAVTDVSKLPVDVHMMVTEPVRYVKRYAELGASGITVHVEACKDVAATLAEIKALGLRTGIALKPATSVFEIEEYIPLVDMVLVMTVEPGFGGQAFMPETLPKISDIRKLADSFCPGLDIQVDGGINAETAKLVRDAGANVLVSGSYLFAAGDMSAASRSLR